MPSLGSPSPRASPGAIDMMLTLAREGLTCPPMVGLEQQIETFGEWHWGTRYVEPGDLYMFRPARVLEWACSGEQEFVLSHWGHGVNSYGLNLVLTVGPLAAFVQHAYGGALTEPIDACVRVARTYARLAVLVRQIPRSPERPRWLLNYSDLRSGMGIIDLQRWRERDGSQDAVESVPTQGALFRLAASKFPELEFGYPTAPVEW